MVELVSKFYALPNLYCSFIHCCNPLSRETSSFSGTFSRGINATDRLLTANFLVTLLSLFVLDKNSLD